MTIALTLHGADAPTIAFDGARLTLAYAAGTYASRCNADDAAVRALPGFVVTSAEVDAVVTIGVPVSSDTPQRATYALAPKPSLSNESPKPRR